jgi:hypothetical protein
VAPAVLSGEKDLQTTGEGVAMSDDTLSDIIRAALREAAGDDGCQQARAASGQRPVQRKRDALALEGMTPSPRAAGWIARGGA